MSRPAVILDENGYPMTNAQREAEAPDEPCWRCSGAREIYFPDGPDGEDVTIVPCDICSTPSDSYAVLPPVGFGER